MESVRGDASPLATDLGLKTEKVRAFGGGWARTPYPESLRGHFPLKSLSNKHLPHGKNLFARLTQIL
jgi:hypothetical protein